MTSASDSSALRYGKATERRAAIQALVEADGFVSVSSLSAKLGVSAVTIRRDVQQLERDHAVQSTHGGVIALSTPVGAGSHFRLRSSRNADAKRAIGVATSQFLAGTSCSTLGIDAGTTALEVAGQLRPEHRMTIVTHSLPVLSTLNGRPSIDVVCVGGTLHPETQAFAGPATLDDYAGLRLEVLVLTATAVSQTLLLCGNSYDAVTKQKMMEVSDTVVLAIDSSKFGIVSPFYIADLSGVDVVVSDDRIAPETLDSLRKLGLEVVVAAVPERPE